jgi:hypothetical protein
MRPTTNLRFMRFSTSVILDLDTNSVYRLPHNLSRSPEWFPTRLVSGRIDS